MLAYLKLLLEKSFEDIPGEIYNQYRQDSAEQLGDSYLFYELSLIEVKPWEFLRDHIYPLFVRYIKSKRVDPATAHGVVVAVFHQDRCYLLQGQVFLEIYRELEGIDVNTFSERVHQWLTS